MHCKYSADSLQSISVMYIKDICNGCEKPKICVSILIKFASAYKIYVRFVYTYIGTYVRIAYKACKLPRKRIKLRKSQPTK